MKGLSTRFVQSHYEECADCTGGRSLVWVRLRLVKYR